MFPKSNEVASIFWQSAMRRYKNDHAPGVNYSGVMGQGGYFAVLFQVRTDS